MRQKDGAIETGDLCHVFELRLKIDGKSMRQQDAGRPFQMAMVPEEKVLASSATNEFGEQSLLFPRRTRCRRAEVARSVEGNSEQNTQMHNCFMKICKSTRLV